jgi:23S rRNA (uracil1939-C5)-methyltransferase
MSRKSDIVEVQARRLGEDGRGVGDAAGLELHVTDLLPGERALVEIEHASPHGRRAWARIVERRGPLCPERVESPCPVFGECGGCVWQHLEPGAQLEHKRQRVQRALDNALVAAPTVPPPVAAPSAYAYRNKGKYVFARDGERVVLGAYRPRSHAVISTVPCLVVEPAIERVAELLVERVEASPLPIHDEKSGTQGLRYAVLRANRAAEVQLTLVCHSITDHAAVAVLAAELAEHREVQGVYRCNNDRSSGVLLTPELELLAGAPTLAENVAGVSVELGPNAFWQIYREQAERAYAEIAELLQLPTGASVLELYCGVGGIAFALATAGHRVLGIEREPEAIEAARAAASVLGERAPRFEIGDASIVADESWKGHDAVVVDPPRKGLGAPLCAQLAVSGIATIAYLSCGPESLARDLKRLCDGGYRIDTVRLYDFMPHTAQVETLVVLRR